MFVFTAGKLGNKNMKILRYLLGIYLLYRCLPWNAFPFFDNHFGNFSPEAVAIIGTLYVVILTVISVCLFLGENIFKK